MITQAHVQPTSYGTGQSGFQAQGFNANGGLEQCGLTRTTREAAQADADRMLAPASRVLKTDRRDAFGRIVGQELNDRTLVTMVSDSALKTLRVRAWDLSDSWDLAVIDNELDRRALAGAEQ